MATTDQKKHLVVVLGMHRSGTSAMTRSLQLLGIELGTHLYAGVPGDNDKGFWEDIDINSLDETLLETLGESWHSLNPALPAMLGGDGLALLRERAIGLLRRKTAEVDWFGMKDPRVARLLPFWKSVFADLDIDVRYLLAIRNPLSVALSLAKRDGFTTEKSLYLWLQHVIPTVLETVGSRRVVMDFDRLMATPETEIRRIAVELGVAGNLDESLLDEYCTSFIEAGLRHSSFSLADLDGNPSVPKLAVEVFATLRRVAAGEVSIDSPEVTAAFQMFAGEMERLRPALQALAQTEKILSRLQSEMMRIDQAIVASEGRVAELNQSVAAQHRRIAGLSDALVQRDGAIGGLNEALTQRDGAIAGLNEALIQRDGAIADLNEALTQRDGAIAGLDEALTQRDGAIAGLNEALTQRDGAIAGLNEALTQRDGAIAGLNGVLIQRDGVIADLNDALALRDRQIAETSAQRDALLKSSSWQITRPLRGVLGVLRGSPAYRDQIRIVLGRFGSVIRSGLGRERRDKDTDH